MTTKIRLTRMGARHQPYYRIVVSDSRRPRDSRFIDVVGHYNPLAKEDQILIDEAKVRQWIDKGATPSQTVKKLLHRTGLLAAWDEEVRAKYRGKREAELRAKAVPLDSIKEKIDSETAVGKDKDAETDEPAKKAPVKKKKPAAKKTTKAAAKPTKAAKDAAAKTAGKKAKKETEEVTETKEVKETKETNETKETDGE